MPEIPCSQKIVAKILAVTLGLTSCLISTNASANGLSRQLAQTQTNSVMEEINEQSYTLDNGLRMNVHTFEGEAGDLLSIEMTSTDFDASLILVGPDGTTLAVNDDRTDVESRDAQIIMRLPATGTYQLLAQAITPGAMGRYTLSKRPLTLAEFEQYNLSTGTYLGTDADLSGGGVATLESSFTAAIPLMEKQITILRQQLGDQHPDVAEQLGWLGTLYLMQNRYDEADVTLNEALNIYRRYPGEYESEIAHVLDTLSAVAYSRGQVDLAANLAQDALANQRQTGDELTVQSANLVSVAFALQAQGRYAEAEELLIENVNVYQKQSEDYDVAIALDMLADLYHIQGRYAEAEVQYQKALAVRQESSTEDFEHPSLLTSFNNLALLYQSQGKYAKAEPLYQQALDTYENFVNFLSENSPISEESINSQERLFVLPVFYNLAGLYRVMDNSRAALSSLRKALAIEERDLDFGLANLGETDRQTYVTKVKDSLNDVLSLHLNSAPDSTEAAELALTTVLRRKGRILEAGTRTIEIIRQYGTPDDQGLLRQFIKLKQQIADLTTASSNSQVSAESQRRLSNLRSESNQLENVLARRSTLLAPPPPAIELSAVQQQIPDNGVLIEYALYQPFDPANPVGDGLSAVSNGPARRFEAPRYAVYLFFPDGTIKAVDLGDAAQIDDAIQSFGNLLTAPSSDFSRASIRVEVADTRVDGIANDIRDLVFDPIAPYIQEQTHLLISPDSQLNRLPFEALQTDDKQFLVEQYHISYLNSGRDLLKFGLTKNSNAADVILANPTYGESALSRGPAAGLNGLGQFAPLPGTAEEVASIAPLLVNPILLTEENATETALKMVERPRILHLATHGFFLPDVERYGNSVNTALFASSGDTLAATATNQPLADPLLRSGLALAGLNSRRSGDDDGLFTALEAANLDLTGTQLVVLSACDTGLGDIASGEGVYGLRRAFSIAGAETQLMSLWQVSDFGTQSLMTNYYENLTSGMGRSEALRTAQLAMINSNSDYAHPYYWAAFILSGDWQPLE